MSTSLQFTLEGMNSLYEEATGYKNQFKAAIENLDTAVKNLSEYWTSEETGTYQQFQSLYNEKKQVLQSALDYMTRFCQKVDEKRADFKAAADKVNREAA